MLTISERCFTMSSIKNKERGSATLYSLFIGMIILTVAIGFNWIVKEHLKASDALQRKMSALLSAYSTYNLLLYTIMPGQFTNQDIILFKGKEYMGIEKLPLNGKEVSIETLLESTSLPVSKEMFKDVKIKLQDTNGMLSLVFIRPFALKNLINQITKDEKRGDIFVDSLLDWIDTDDLTRINGAERSYYEKEGKSYAPRNYEVQYKEEIKLIRGMDESLYQKIEPFITILPNSGFNPNTAPPEVLKAYLNIDDDVLQNLLNYISKKPILSDSELYSITARKIVIDEGVYFYPSHIVELTVSVGKPEPVYTIKAGVDLRLKTNTPFEILYWKES